MSTTVRSLSLPAGFVSKPENATSVKSGFVPTTAKCGGCKYVFSKAYMQYHPRVSALACKSCFARLDAQAKAAPPKRTRGIGSGSKGPNQTPAARAARRAVRTECPKGPQGSSQKWGPGKVGPQKAGMLNKGRAKK